MQRYIKCAKHIKCEFNYSFILSFNHSYVTSFLIFAKSSLPLELFFLFCFLKLEVQLHSSLHDSKNSLLSLWLCHGFSEIKTMLFVVKDIFRPAHLALRWYEEYLSSHAQM